MLQGHSSPVVPDCWQTGNSASQGMHDFVQRKMYSTMKNLFIYIYSLSCSCVRAWVGWPVSCLSWVRWPERLPNSWINSRLCNANLSQPEMKQMRKITARDATDATNHSQRCNRCDQLKPITVANSYRRRSASTNCLSSKK